MIKAKKEEVYLPISRWRAKIGEPYIYVTDMGNVVMGLDLRWDIHNERYENQNYFKNYATAYESDTYLRNQ
ncbi:MAG: hypothetical protein ACRC6B_09115 [Fusobacteriaceae bacterium]